jgi:hypothetical protein
MLFGLVFAGFLGTAAAGLPALAASSSNMELEVNQSCYIANWPCWIKPGGNLKAVPPLKVSVSAGSEIKFVDKDPEVMTAVVWAGSEPTCTGVPATAAAAATGWEGTCKFETAGTYKFESVNLWPEYNKYEVVVEGAGGGTTTTSTTTTMSMTTTATMPGEGNAPVEKQTRKSTDSLSGGSLRLSAHQRGSHIRGSLQVAEGDSKLIVEAFAAKAQLGAGGHQGQARVARLSKSLPYGGRESFSLALDANALRALHKHGHLTLTVKLQLSGPGGVGSKRTVTVVVHKS